MWKASTRSNFKQSIVAGAERELPSSRLIRCERTHPAFGPSSDAFRSAAKPVRSRLAANRPCAMRAPLATSIGAHSRATRPKPPQGPEMGLRPSCAEGGVPALRDPSMVRGGRSALRGAGDAWDRASTPCAVVRAGAKRPFLIAQFMTFNKKPQGTPHDPSPGR